MKFFKSVIIVRNFGTKNSFTKNWFFEKKKKKKFPMSFNLKMHFLSSFKKTIFLKMQSQRPTFLYYHLSLHLFWSKIFFGKCFSIFKCLFASKNSQIYKIFSVNYYRYSFCDNGQNARLVQIFPWVLWKCLFVEN